MTDLLLAAFAQVFGPQPSREHKFTDTPDYGEPDLYVSPSDARHMQMRYDNLLEREAS